MKIETLQGQTFLDIVMQSTGDAENAVAMAVLNNVTLTSDLTVGDVFESTAITNNRIVTVFSALDKKPATAWDLKNTIVQPRPQGISFWAINVDFEVTAE